MHLAKLTSLFAKFTPVAERNSHTALQSATCALWGRHALHWQQASDELVMPRKSNGISIKFKSKDI